MENEKITRDVAENEFERWAEIWDIDTDVESMDSEDKEEFEKLKRRFIRAIINGRALIHEDCSIEFRLRKSVREIESIKIFKPSGNAFLSMDRHKDRQNIHKMNSFLGNMCNQDPKIFGQMDGADYKFFLGIITLFLAS